MEMERFDARRYKVMCGGGMVHDKVSSDSKDH